ncbi:MAG: hypothetical protein HY904_15505 [Deltaproteobacteria bacterium]|nr:hypothetical protein [Deltaproteobacteria bacterium]
MAELTTSPIHDGARALGFALRFADGRALLQARGLALDVLLGLPRGVVVEELALQVPNVTFPVDMAGGSERFQHRRLVTRHVELRISLGALRAFLPATLGGAEVEQATLSASHGELRLEAEVRAGGAQDVLLLHVAPLAAPPTDLELVVTRARRVGDAPGSALAAVGDLLARAGTDDSPLVRRVDVVRRAVNLLLVSHGWKVPDHSALREIAVRVEEDGLRITCSADPLPQSAAPPEAAEGLARAAAANPLLWDGIRHGLPARARLDRAVGHPLALSLLAEALREDPSAREEAAAAMDEALARNPQDPDVTLAWARLRGGSAEDWQRVVAAARVASDPALVHAAALSWARALRGADAGAALSALEVAGEARPTSARVAMEMAQVALAAGRFADAVAAARRALDLPLPAADEAAASLVLGRARMELGDLPGARRALLRAVRHGETSTALEALARLHGAEGRHAEAVRHALRAAELAPPGVERARALALAAESTGGPLGDVAGASPLWQRALSEHDDPAWRAAAAEAAWALRDVELVARWTLGPGAPQGARVSLLGGLALWRLKGRDADALALLERAGTDAGCRTPDWEQAMAELRGRAPEAVTVLPAAPLPLPPRDATVTTREEPTGVTRALVSHGPADEDAPGPGENIHDALPFEADQEEPTQTRQLLAPGVRSPVTVEGLAALSPAEAVGAFVAMWAAPAAPRDALVHVLRRLAGEAPDRALAIVREMRERASDTAADWRALVTGARVRGLPDIERAGLEGLRAASPEDADGVELRLVELLCEHGSAEEALERLVPQALQGASAAICSRAADLAEELGQVDTALRVMEAAEGRAQGLEALQWARRARQAASLAGRHTEAVAAARRAARKGSADDVDQLEDALEAAGEYGALCDALWQRARNELDADRAVRAARLELTASGRGALVAVRGILGVLETGVRLTEPLRGAIRDCVRGAADGEERAQALMRVLAAAVLPEGDRMEAAAELEGLTLPEPLASEAEAAVLSVWPNHAPALARTARRCVESDPARAVRAAMELAKVLAERGGSAMERLTWLRFAATHAQRANPEAEEQAAHQLLELARREPEAARAAGVERRALLWRLADIYEQRNEPEEALRTLSQAEALEGAGEDRAQVFRRLALLEEKLGHGDRAAEALERSFRAHPEDEEVARALQRVLEGRGRHLDLAALHEYRARSTEGPRRTAHLISAADLYAGPLGQPARAVQLCREALRAAPLSDAPLKRLMDLHRTLPPASLVRTCLMVARLRQTPEVASYLEEAGAVLAGIMQRPRLAVAVLQGALRLDPRAPAALRALAELFRAMDRPEDAAAVQLRLLDATPEGPARQELHIARAEILSKELGRDQEAWAELQAAGMDEGEMAWALPLRQQVAERAGRAVDVEAVVALRVKREADPEEAARLALEGARALVRLGAADAAVRVARWATDRHPGYPTAWSALRDVAVLANDIPTQLDATQHLVDMLRERQPQLAAVEAARLGDLARAQGRALDAVRAYGMALQLGRDDGISWKLGEALLAAGDAPEAWAVLGRLEPSHAAGVTEEAFARTLARAATEAGVFESAALWGRVTELSPGDADAWRRLGAAAEAAGAWSQAADAWGRAATLVEGPLERARFLRRQARALADASRHAEAADVLQTARALGVGPPAEYVLLARWRLSAADAAAAARALLQGRDEGAEIPEEILAETALRLAQTGARALARELLLPVTQAATPALAGALLELRGADLPPREQARLLLAVASAAVEASQRAELLERAAHQAWTAGDAEEAVRAAAAAVAAETTPARQRLALGWALESGRLADVGALLEAVPPDVAAQLGERAEALGRLADLPDALIQKWASLPRASPAALSELARRALDRPAGEKEALLTELAQAADRAAGEGGAPQGEAAVRQLAEMFAQRGDFEAARAWSLKLRAPAVEDLRRRLAWFQELERWRDVLDTLGRLCPLLPASEEPAAREQAVEVARDRLEDPAAALPHCRRWADLVPDHRPARAALVELLEETGALREAAAEVSSWAERQQGVEAQALWSKALQLAVDVADPALTLETARRAHAALPSREHARAHAEALRAAGQLAEAAEVRAHAAEEAGEEDEVLAAADELDEAGQGTRAGELLLRAFPSPRGGLLEERVLDVLSRARLHRALADRLRAGLTAHGDEGARLRFLQWMPRVSTTPMEVARVTREAAENADRADLWMDAARASVAVGLLEDARAQVDRAYARGGRGEDVTAVRTALAPEAGAPRRVLEGAPGWEEHGWLAGDLPDALPALEARASWTLRRVEARAAQDARVDVAVAALRELLRRGMAVDGDFIRRRPYLAGDAGRALLRELVSLRPHLGPAACDVAVVAGPAAVRDLAWTWAQLANTDAEAADALDRLAGAAANELDADAEYRALWGAQARVATPRRARRLLELARARGDREHQLEALEQLARLGPAEQAAAWQAERGQLLLEEGRLVDAMDALQAGQAPAPLWEAAWRRAAAAGAEALQARALEHVADSGADMLALAALWLRLERFDDAAAWIGHARQAGVPPAAADWAEADLHALRRDADEERRVLTSLAAQGSVAAVDALSRLAGADENAELSVLRDLVATAEPAVVLDALRRVAARGPATCARVTDALAGWCDPDGGFPPALQRAAELLGSEEPDVAAAQILGGVAERLGFPEVARRAFEVLSQQPGAKGRDALRVLATVARRQGRPDEERSLLAMLLVQDPAQPAVHERVAALADGHDAWLHVLAAGALAGTTGEALARVRAAARDGRDELWADQCGAALLGAQGTLGEPVGRRLGLAEREALAAQRGFPPAALVLLVEEARREGARDRLRDALEAALAHGRVPPEQAHLELAGLWEESGVPRRALHHVARALDLLPGDGSLLKRRVDLARAAGDTRALAEALVEAARKLPEERAADPLLEAAHLWTDRLADPVRALEILEAYPGADARIRTLRVELARLQGDPARLATALEAALDADTGTDPRALAALDAADAFEVAGEPSRAMAVLNRVAAQSAAACAAVRDAALARGAPLRALAAVRARWSAADRDERRELVGAWLARRTAGGEAVVLEGSRDLALMQSNSDAEDAATLLWLCRDAEHARRWEAAVQRWQQLAALSVAHALPEEVTAALLTEGVAVLARTGSLDEAERLAVRRIEKDPSDRSAVEVLLAAARGRGDAADVVRLLSTIARHTGVPAEKAFIWREAAEWLGGPLMDPQGAVNALRAAGSARPLTPAEAEWMARLAAQAQDSASELDALDAAAADGAARVRGALRRAELMELRDRPAEDTLAALRDALGDPGSVVAAAQKLADMALRTARAADALGWLGAVAPPTGRREATRYWQSRALLAEAAGVAPEAIKAHAELASLGENRSAARVAHWMMKSGRPAQAARAYLDAASRESAASVKAELLREAVTAWEAVPDAAAADDARLQLLEVDPRDITTFDAVEVRLRRQGKTARLAPLAQRVAAAQEEPTARAAMFERAGTLWRDVGGDEAQAAAAFGSALEADPLRSRVALALADLAFRRNNLEAAARWFARVPDSADGDLPGVPAAEVAYRRGACLESTGGDGRAALRRALEVDPEHAAARQALARAAERHGDPMEAVRTLMEARDVPSASDEPRAFAAWMLRQAATLQNAGQGTAARALLERAHTALPGNPSLLRALALSRLEDDAAAAAVLFRRVAQLAGAPDERQLAFRDEAAAWEKAGNARARAEALLQAVLAGGADAAVLVSAVDAAAAAEAEDLLATLAGPLHAAQPPVDLPPALHRALAQALRQERNVPPEQLLRHAEAALAADDGWRGRLLAVDAARRAGAHAAWVGHVEAALRNVADPKMGATLAADAARVAFVELRDAARGAALVRTAVGLAGTDAKLRARLTDLFPAPPPDPALAEAAARALLDDNADLPEAYTWLERAFVSRSQPRRAQLAREAAALLAGKPPPPPPETPLPSESGRALALSKDASWLAPGEFPVHMARLASSWNRELHALLERPEIPSRSLSGDEARRLAADIRFARSLADGTLPVVITEQPGAFIGGLTGPHLVLGPDVVRAPDAVRRAVMAVGFATVRWGLEPSVCSSTLELTELMRAMAAFLGRPPEQQTPRSRELAQVLEKALRSRVANQPDDERAAAVEALNDGRLPGVDEGRALLGRVAFLAAGSLAVALDALDRMAWMEKPGAFKTMWSRGLLRWACLEEGLEARQRLGLEEAAGA